MGGGELTEAMAAFFPDVEFSWDAVGEHRLVEGDGVLRRDSRIVLRGDEERGWGVRTDELFA